MLIAIIAIAVLYLGATMLGKRSDPEHLQNEREE